MLIRHSEYEAFMVCKNEGIGVIPWAPLHRYVLYVLIKANLFYMNYHRKLMYLINAFFKEQVVI